MEIIWSQVITQIIGFVIAVLILKRYAWGPILRLLEERRAKIAGEFERIETEKKGVAAMKQEVEAQLRGIEAQSRARIQEGVQEGQKFAAEIKEQARLDARGQIARAQVEIEQERKKAHVTLRGDMVDMVLTATEKLIGERLDDAKHRSEIEKFVTELDTVEFGGGPAR
jgi:F-type H+-transporting ATPase subunit b